MQDYLLYFCNCWRRFQWKALYKQFRFEVRRPFSRQLLQKYSPIGAGLEIGVGYQTVAPMSRTVLSDAFQTHGADLSLAKEFFPSHQIPYSDGHFSFILSEHMLEHSANPLMSLREWQRVLQPNGVLYLFLPHKERTFDKDRPRTTLAHLIEDEKADQRDDDTTHLQEWMNLVITPGRAPHYSHVPRQDMARLGVIHHHVWIAADVVELLQHLDFEILEQHEQVPDRFDSFVVVARKRAPNTTPTIS